MYLLFQSIFTWAAPVMDGVEAVIAGTADIILPLLPAGMVSDFVADALFGGDWRLSCVCAADFCIDAGCRTA